MIHNKAVVIFAILCITFASESSARNCRRKPCLVRRKCSNIEDVVWASDGSNCYVFRNKCFFLTENCNRQNADLNDLKTVSQAKCQQKCRNFCTMEYRPVCGVYNNVKRTFSNSCELSNHICQTGETYTVYSNFACEQETSAI